jgi:pyrroline-5-carboxylate reductase
VSASADVILVGGGNMGHALVTGWLTHGRRADGILVIEPDPARAAALAALPGLRLATTPAALPAGAGVVVLAVKPQVVDAVAPLYAPLAAAGAVVLSIAAGRTLASLAAACGVEAAIVRAMPNTPAAIGRGISVAVANTRVSPAQRALCETLLAAVGEVAWVGDEALMDAVTAVSGSGPAYVFLLAECLAAAGRSVGLPAELADRLARSTVAGAGELLARSGLPAEDLRRQVTSPGGTTAAALSVLMGGPGGLASLMTMAVERAAERSRELAG